MSPPLPQEEPMLPVRQDKMPVSLSNGSLTPPSTAPAMNWAESMPHEYQVRETADLSGLDNVEFGELKRLNDKVIATPDDYEPWDALVRAVEALEGGLNRNSSPQAIAAFRDIYNRFLAKFPLFFVYWKRYADKEFVIAGTEAAESVYERGVACIPNSVDLWTNYCNFKVETSHDVDVIRELFERASQQVGLDYQAHPFWDKYIEFEERVEQPANVLSLLERIVHIPTQKYREYFEKFRTLLSYRPLNELPSISQWQEEAQKVMPHAGSQEMEREIRTRIDNYYLTVYNTTQGEVMKRTVHEDGIKRPYFHVTEIEDSELTVWRKYLDFEESEGSYERTKFLYERCVVICALYEEFWLRYVRWLEAQPDKTEEARIVYQRASTVFVPIMKPTIRLHYALFEEVQERVQVARDMHIAILEQLPSHLETIVSLANLERRHGGIDAAIEVYKSYITSQQTDLFAKGALVAEWANMLWKVKGSPEEARDIYRSQAEYYSGSRPFWVNYFLFELQQVDTSPKQYQRVKKVFEDIAHRSQILPAAVKDLGAHYKAYLLERGTGDAAKEYLRVDREINGPPSIRIIKSKALDDGKSYGSLYSEGDTEAGISALRLGLAVSDKFHREASEAFASNQQSYSNHGGYRG